MTVSRRYASSRLASGVSISNGLHLHSAPRHLAIAGSVLEAQDLTTRGVQLSGACFAQEVDEPDKARGPIEQILSRGGEGQAHVTFAELAECVARCDCYVLALDEGSSEIHRGCARLRDIGPHVE